MKDNEKSSDLSVEEAVPVYDIRYTIDLSEAFEE